MSKSRYAYMAEKGACWEKARLKYDAYVNLSCKPTTKKLRPDHVEDEDKSVKWNRQFVEANNNKHANEVKELNRKKNALLVEAQNMVKCMICEELDWKLTDDDIDRLFNRWYDRYHSDGFRYMCNMIESECDAIREMDWWKFMKVRNN